MDRHDLIIVVYCLVHDQDHVAIAEHVIRQGDFCVAQTAEEVGSPTSAAGTLKLETDRRE